MKRISWIFLTFLVLLIFFIPVCASSLTSLDINKVVFLIIYSKEATLKHDPEKADDYILTLSQPTILFFYDRPWRQEGNSNISEVLSLWKSNVAINGKNTLPNGTWITDPAKQDRVHLVNIVIHDITAQPSQLSFKVQGPNSKLINLKISEYKKDVLEKYLNKTINNSILSFSIP